MFRQIVFTGVLALVTGAALAHDRHGHGMLERADANKDGSIARDEFLAAREQQFARFDRNSDNVIDDADRGERAKQHAGERAAKMRGQLDTNSDGKISKEEFISGGAPLFDQTDTDGNGVLEPQELEAFRAAAKARHQELRKR